MNFFYFIENFHIMLTKKAKLDEGSFYQKKNENVAIWRQWIPIGYKD